MKKPSRAKGGRVPPEHRNRSIRAGQKSPELLSEKLRDCDVLLALIGPRWLDLKNEDTAQRRLEGEQDFVRFEIASALAMHKLVVPVLLTGAKMPRPAELPESIRELAWINAFELRHNRWATDLTDPSRATCKSVA